jgi:hypothetical protein
MTFRTIRSLALREGARRHVAPLAAALGLAPGRRFATVRRTRDRLSGRVVPTAGPFVEGEDDLRDLVVDSRSDGTRTFVVSTASEDGTTSVVHVAYPLGGTAAIHSAAWSRFGDLVPSRVFLGCGRCDVVVALATRIDVKDAARLARGVRAHLALNVLGGRWNGTDADPRSVAGYAPVDDPDACAVPGAVDLDAVPSRAAGIDLPAEGSGFVEVVGARRRVVGDGLRSHGAPPTGEVVRLTVAELVHFFAGPGARTRAWWERVGSRVA